MAKPKGAPKTGGRAKGTPNKVTQELKDMILGALDDAGGRKYLKAQSISNPTAFLTLVGKVLPMTVQGPGVSGALVIRWAEPGEAE